MCEGPSVSECRRPPACVGKRHVFNWILLGVNSDVDPVIREDLCLLNPQACVRMRVCVHACVCGARVRKTQSSEKREGEKKCPL